ncbi:hypothetical protein Scani_01600 [Streptomyces caniferus]|uniref:DUF1648 domain-containing protein n=1 Tax=Streptomyces caniferus TaxID=285557 RepID=A0A640RZN9_9ACTN|nr:DUF1648 domain-containing protein [Streptomyces caniferus]GFE03892.1 hypothetical protein Scani_01600 [Streptomyces caniferus]
MKSAPRAAFSSAGPRRTWMAAFPFLVVIMTLGGLYAEVAGRLPDPLAGHFDGGRANGFSSAPGFLAGCLAVLLVLGVGSGLLVRLRGHAPEVPWLIAASWATAAGIGYSICRTLLANVDVADAAAVREPQWQTAVGLGVALLAGALGRLLAGAAPLPPRRAAAATPRLDLPDGTTAGWSRTISSPPLVVLGVALLGAGLVLGVLAGWLSAAGLLFGGAACLPLASVRVTVDRHGLSLSPAMLPCRVRLRRIPLERIAEAGSRRVACFAEFGGWGYRLRAGGSGLVLRSGEGIVVRLTNGKEFVVTVDDAATAAALLNTYTDRARARQGG